MTENTLLEKMNFVEAKNSKILNFIQENTRTLKKMEKELEEIKVTYDDEVDIVKGRLMDLEYVKSLGTGKERESKVKSLLIDEMKDSVHLKEMSVLKNEIYGIKNELNLAREIYKLKNFGKRDLQTKKHGRSLNHEFV